MDARCVVSIACRSRRASAARRSSRTAYSWSTMEVARSSTFRSSTSRRMRASSALTQPTRSPPQNSFDIVQQLR